MRKNNISIVCQQCRKEFVVPFHMRTRRFCNQPCSKLWWSKHKRKIRECPVCKKYFEFQQHTLKKFCSRGCYEIYRVQTTTAAIGVERIRKCKGNSFVVIKTKTGWKPKHLYLAEIWLGQPACQGEQVVFRDGNCLNCTPENILVKPLGKIIEHCPDCGKILKRWDARRHGKPCQKCSRKKREFPIGTIRTYNELRGTTLHIKTKTGWKYIPLGEVPGATPAERIPKPTPKRKRK